MTPWTETPLQVTLRDRLRIFCSNDVVNYVYRSGALIWLLCWTYWSWKMEGVIPLMFDAVIIIIFGFELLARGLEWGFSSTLWEALYCSGCALLWHQSFGRIHFRHYLLLLLLVRYFIITLVLVTKPYFNDEDVDLTAPIRTASAFASPEKTYSSVGYGVSID